MVSMLFLDALRTARVSSIRLKTHSKVEWFVRLYLCLRRGHSENPAARDRDLTAIILSYKRPQNIAPLVGMLLKAPSIRNVIISNNNPDLKMGDWFRIESPRVSIVNQDRARACPIRYQIAQQLESRYFIAIDDDVFLRPSQIETLCAALRADPSRPWGILGMSYDDSSGKMQYNICRPGEVDILNQVYAFTSDHVRRFFELANALGFGPAHEAWERSNWDDIVISHSGVSRPCVCDVGAVTGCPTGAEPGIAVWKEDGFLAGRLALFQQLRALLARQSYSTSTGSEVIRLVSTDGSIAQHKELHAVNSRVTGAPEDG
jgi:hypothetical protein